MKNTTLFFTKVFFLNKVLIKHIFNDSQTGVLWYIKICYIIEAFEYYPYDVNLNLIVYKRKLTNEMKYYYLRVTEVVE